MILARRFFACGAPKRLLQALTQSERACLFAVRLSDEQALPLPAEKEPHFNRHQRRSGGRDHQATEQHPPRPERRDGRVHHNDDGGLPGVAFGDHTPAFLLRRGRSSEAR